MSFYPYLHLFTSVFVFAYVLVSVSCSSFISASVSALILFIFCFLMESLKILSVSFSFTFSISISGSVSVSVYVTVCVSICLQIHFFICVLACISISFFISDSVSVLSFFLIFVLSSKFSCSYMSLSQCMSMSLYPYRYVSNSVFFFVYLLVYISFSCFIPASVHALRFFEFCSLMEILKFIQCYLLLLVRFIRYPDWALWLNYEVVEFQPRSGISTNLGSGASITYYSRHALPTCLSRIYVSLYSPPPSYAFPHQ